MGKLRGKLKGEAKKLHTRLQQLFKEVRKELRNIPLNKRDGELPQNVETMFEFLQKLGYNPKGANFKEFLNGASKGSTSEKYAVEVFDRNIQERKSALMNAYKAEIKDKSFDIETDRRRRKTFDSRFGITGDEYDRITDLLGSDTFTKIKEKGLLDSSQLIDLSQILTKNTNAEIMENVMTMLLRDESLSEYGGRQAIIDTLNKLGMEVGQSYIDPAYNERMFKLKLHSMFNFKGDGKHM